MTFSEFKLLFPKALIEGPSAFELLQKQAEPLISRSLFAESFDFAVGLMTAHIAECLYSREGGYSQLTAQTVGSISQTYATLDGSNLSRSRYGAMLAEMMAARGGVGILWIGAT